MIAAHAIGPDGRADAREKKKEEKKVRGFCQRDRRHNLLDSTRQLVIDHRFALKDS